MTHDISSETIPQYRSSEEPKRASVDLSIETLKQIEWYSFELFCKSYYESLGYGVKKSGAGADKGIDLYLYREGNSGPSAIVQCKARSKKSIGVSYTRELLGVKTAEKMEKAVLISNSNFTKEALSFAGNHGIELVDVYTLHTTIKIFPRRNSSFYRSFLHQSTIQLPPAPTAK